MIKVSYCGNKIPKTRVGDRGGCYCLQSAAASPSVTKYLSVTLSKGTLAGIMEINLLLAVTPTCFTLDKSDAYKYKSSFSQLDIFSMI